MDKPEQPTEPPRYEAPPPGGAGPGQQGQPGYPYQPPIYNAQPPRQSNPWMWVGITCLVVGFLAVVAVGICVVWLLRNEDFKKAMGAMTEEMPRMQTCDRQLTAIGQALQRYAADHDGAFPDKLDDLVSKYMKDDSEFSCPSDEHGDQYTYYKPEPSDPDDTVVIECDRHSMGVVPVRLQLHKDGSVTQGN